MDEKRTKYYAILPNFRQQEYDALSIALTATDFLVIVETLNGTDYNHGWLTRSITIELLSNCVNKTDGRYSCAGWHFEIVKSYYFEPKGQIGKNAKHRIRFTDPYGAIREFETPFAHMRSGDFNWLFQYVALFQKYSLEHCLREADLIEENEKLKNEIVLLQKSILSPTES